MTRALNENVTITLSYVLRKGVGEACAEEGWEELDFYRDAVRRAIYDFKLRQKAMEPEKRNTDVRGFGFRSESDQED